MKKQTVLIIVIMAALLAGAAALWAVNNSGADMPTGGAALLVKADGSVLKQYTMDELRELPSVSIDKTIVSGNDGKHSGKQEESGRFTGVALETLMADADPSWDDRYSEFVLTAEDGFVSAVFLSEVQKKGNVVIAYEKDGAPIQGKEAGGLGPLRVVVADDEFGNRSAWYLKTIEAKE